MNPSALALTGFAAWTLLLVVSIGLYWAYFVFSGQRTPNQFDPSGAGLTPLALRLSRAHANCYENLPIFGALIAVALVTGRQGLTDPLAMWFLYLRLGQSVVHIASTSNIAVNLRFALFLGQVAIMAVMAWRLIML